MYWDRQQTSGGGNLCCALNPILECSLRRAEPPDAYLPKPHDGRAKFMDSYDHRLDDEGRMEYDRLLRELRRIFLV
jgi:hypothetical protein